MARVYENKLVYRKATKEDVEIMFKLFTGEITFIEAHNELIKKGIYLTEDYTLLDY